jgi:hypothetical protein
MRSKNEHMKGFEMEKITIEINDLNAVSDGYHTIQELYDHRCLLFISLINTNKGLGWHATKHYDGSFLDGWFIAGMNLNGKQITYHLPNNFRSLIASDVVELDFAPEWDGHTSSDVLDRLTEWLTV